MRTETDLKATYLGKEVLGILVCFWEGERLEISLYPATCISIRSSSTHLIEFKLSNLMFGYKLVWPILCQKQKTTMSNQSECSFFGCHIPRKI